MPQASGTPPTNQPSSDWPRGDAPSYRYDPHLGSPRDTYTRIDIKTSRLHHPELAGRFVAHIEGETIVSSAMGRRARQWRVEPGTPCLILGHWSDGTVHLKWRSGYFALDGRFPAWVVEEDKSARMAGGGFILAASEPLPLPRGLSQRVLRAVLLLLAAGARGVSGRARGGRRRDFGTAPRRPLSAVLQEIERYYDAVPRSAARVESIGAFEVFIKVGAGWPFYARPQLGAREFSVADVERVRARQRELGVPESFEWVAEMTPTLAAAAEAGGLNVHAHPLLLLDRFAQRDPVANGVDLRIVRPDDDLARFGAVPAIAFKSSGTEVGSVGTEALADAAAKRSVESIAFERQRLVEGLTVSAVALVNGEPVALGSHQPVGGVTEIVGVGTLPAFRRRGIGAALTAVLVDDALQRGVSTVFLSAGDDAVARVYERVGFRRIATACIAEPVAVSHTEGPA